MKGISKATNIPLGKLKELLSFYVEYVLLALGEVVLYNIFYEASTACTSIIGQNENGQLLHARNLDFGLFMG